MNTLTSGGRPLAPTSRRSGPGRALSLLPALLLALALAACGAKMEGSYADPAGLTKYEFEPSGKVYLSVLGVRSEAKYEVDGKHIKITGGAADMILTRQEGGSLEGPLGVKFRRQK
jgi:hypothetical protein